MSPLNSFLPWLICVILAGCAVGPNYRPPDLANRLPAQYGNADASVSPAAVPDHWWKIFKDPARQQPGPRIGQC
jgi:outer membrane protein TolC